ncbi:type II secretion system F family protein [Leekyejoonella antrihumi]|uniref:Type II secretion system F family protein n=1 Tax=Leekyejoonella antrihumi TaxID=1660198 RepID=A0A563E076_9MICO|nr:type II secretion system F family protein [Leekyejoonella antrihumi]TWP35948.1 type II secretion system F family protein [Leekyejoonella antrihumi]
MTALLGPLVGLASVLVYVLVIVGYRRMRSDTADGLAVEDLVLLRSVQKKEARGRGAVGRLAAPFVPLLRRSLGHSRIAALQRLIDEAGRPDGMTVDEFLTRVVMWYLLVVPLALIRLVQGSVLTALVAMAVPLLLTFGKLVGSRRKRRDGIDSMLPDFLDILAVTVTAGVAFRPALARVSSRFEGPLGAEIEITMGQLQNGASVRQAFTGLKERNSSDSMNQFVSAFLQSEELGAPLADTLNTIASDMRRGAAQRMRRKAARASPQITLVTSLVLVPAVLIMVLVGIIVGSDVNLGMLFG